MYLQLDANLGELLLDVIRAPPHPRLLTDPVRVSVERVLRQHGVAVVEDGGDVGAGLRDVPAPLTVAPELLGGEEMVSPGHGAPHGVAVHGGDVFSLRDVPASPHCDLEISR